MLPSRRYPGYPYNTVMVENEAPTRKGHRSYQFLVNRVSRPVTLLCFQKQSLF